MSLRVEEGGAELEDSPPIAPGEAFRIALPNFEGPLDLLLHLIKEHRLDIFDIPIALVAEKYVDYLDRMRELNLDVASEFLVMAATLAHLKSRLLLPRPELQAEPESAEPVDVRAELVRRLLEYQKYKDAAATLARQDILDRDVFPRRVAPERPAAPEAAGLVEISIYKLIEALDRVLKNATPPPTHDVVKETVSLSVAMSEIVARLEREPKVSFFALFEARRERSAIVITFLALLELCKQRWIRIFQGEDDEDIVVTPNGDVLASFVSPEVDEREYT